jgi:hypothetical protein
MGKHRYRANYVTDKTIIGKNIIQGYSISGYINHTGSRCKAVTRLLRHTHFKERHALVGDGIQRFNLAIEAVNHANPKDYINAAEMVSKLWIEDHERDFDKKAKIHSHLDMLKSPLCQNIIAHVKKLYDADENCKIAFDHTADDYLTRFKKRLANEEKPTPSSFNDDTAKALSLQALMEEYAVILYLAIETKAHYFAYPDIEPQAFRYCRERILPLIPERRDCGDLHWLRIKVKQTPKAATKNKSKPIPVPIKNKEPASAASSPGTSSSSSASLDSHAGSPAESESPSTSSRSSSDEERAAVSANAFTTMGPAPTQPGIESDKNLALRTVLETVKSCENQHQVDNISHFIKSVGIFSYKNEQPASYTTKEGLLTAIPPASGKSPPNSKTNLLAAAKGKDKTTIVTARQPNGNNDTRRADKRRHSPPSNFGQIPVSAAALTSQPETQPENKRIHSMDMPSAVRVSPHVPAATEAATNSPNNFTASAPRL